MTRLMFIGGFLGAGKTTLIGKTAELFAGKNQKVGIITNDQASELVDTALLRCGGNETAEVSGSCFCCNFPALEAAVESFLEKKVSVILAEPVGSCTDISATVMQPSKDRLRGKVRLAPLSVVADPERLAALLRNDMAGFLPSAVYILRKQLEEADAILINKKDLLSPATMANLRHEAAKAFPEAKIYLISAKTGDGVGEWLADMVLDGLSGTHLAEVDYDIYAEGEAALGWLNAEMKLTGDQVQWKPFAERYLHLLSDTFASKKAEIGHVKLLLMSDEGYLAGNITKTGEMPQFRGYLPDSGIATMTLNARVQMPPDELQAFAFDTLARTCGDAVAFEVGTSNCLQPGRPNPTYRYDAVASA